MRFWHFSWQLGLRLILPILGMFSYPHLLPIFLIISLAKIIIFFTTNTLTFRRHEMKLRKKICCEENVSNSSIGQIDQTGRSEKYKLAIKNQNNGKLVNIIKLKKFQT